MKKLLFGYIIASILALTSDAPVKKLNGAYQRTRFQYGEMKKMEAYAGPYSIKVFKDGYWFAASKKYDDQKKPVFDGACGGTYDLKNGKYNEHVAFYSWDSTAIGSTYVMNFKVNQKEFRQYGKMNSEKWPNYLVNDIMERITPTKPLKDSRLEGVWFLETAQYGNDKWGEGRYKDMIAMKIYAYPLAVNAFYNPKTKQFLSAGVSLYQFDGVTLSETRELRSNNHSAVGVTVTNSIELKDNKIIQDRPLDKQREVFVKAQ